MQRVAGIAFVKENLLAGEASPPSSGEQLTARRFGQHVE
jgi:hypothetical protein